jgi:hypothetical protein
MRHMWLWRLVLVLIALSFTGFGFASIFKPAEMTAITSVVVPTAEARTDVRATYGGLEFGVGVFLLLCAFRHEFVRVGLFAAVCVLVAMATARTLGILVDGFSFIQTLIALSEWVGGGLATYGALMAKPAPDTLPPPTEDPTP